MAEPEFEEDALVGKGNDLLVKYDFYLTALTFSILALAIQTGKLIPLYGQVYFECIAWICLLMSASIGLLVNKQIGPAYTTWGYRKSLGKYASKIDEKKIELKKGIAELIDEKDKDTTRKLNLIDTKRRIREFSFALGLLLLMLSRILYVASASTTQAVVITQGAQSMVDTVATTQKSVTGTVQAANTEVVELTKRVNALEKHPWDNALTVLCSGLLGVIISIFAQRQFMRNNILEDRKKEHLSMLQKSLTKFIDDKYIWYNEDTATANVWYKEVTFHFPNFVNMLAERHRKNVERTEQIELGYKNICQNVTALQTEIGTDVTIHVCDEIKENFISVPAAPMGFNGLYKNYEQGKLVGMLMQPLFELVSGQDKNKFKFVIDKLYDYSMDWRKNNDIAKKIVELNTVCGRLERQCVEEGFRVLNLQYLPKDCDYIKEKH